MFHGITDAGVKRRYPPLTEDELLITTLPHDVHRVILSFMDRPALEYGLYETSTEDCSNKKRYKTGISIAWNVKDKIEPHKVRCGAIEGNVLDLIDKRYGYKSINDSIEAMIKEVNERHQCMFKSQLGVSLSDIDLYAYWGITYNRWRYWAEQCYHYCVGESSSDEYNFNRTGHEFGEKRKQWYQKAIKLFDNMSKGRIYGVDYISDYFMKHAVLHRDGH